MHEQPEAEELMRRIQKGDPSAIDELLKRHRRRLRRMVAVRIDPRLSARVDPSDVVQDALLEATRKLQDYVRERPLPFYPWLRQLAWNRLIDLHRRNVLAQARSVTREVRWDMELSDQSVADLASGLIASGTSPSGQLQRREFRDWLRDRLARLSERDREVLVLRHLEELSVNEIAAVLNISVEAVKKRHVRALKRLRDLLGPQIQGEQP
jgi:RNA polymerase sigma-70 factor (ECF subfamily)